MDSLGFWLYTFSCLAFSNWVFERWSWCAADNLIHTGSPAWLLYSEGVEDRVATSDFYDCPIIVY